MQTGELLIPPGETRTDEALLAAVAGGDETSFRVLMARFKKPILNYIYHYVRDAGWAEDLAQDVFVKIYRKAGSFKPENKFAVWLFQIARNRAIDFLRTRKSEGRAMAEMQSDSGDIGRPSKRPVSHMIKREDEDHLHDALGELPEHYRDVLVLCDLNDLSYEAAGQIVDTPAKTISSRLYRARNALRKKFAPFIKS
ncbi:RNA polymerase sigma factor [Planctomycetota bacterium]